MLQRQNEGLCKLRDDLLSNTVYKQDARKPFVAYFGAAGTLGRPRMHAWMSRSTRGLRERLRAEPHGLVFTAPLAPGADVSFRDERMQAELKEASQVVSPSNVLPGSVSAAQVWLLYACCHGTCVTLRALALSIEHHITAHLFLFSSSC